MLRGHACFVQSVIRTLHRTPIVKFDNKIFSKMYLIVQSNKIKSLMPKCATNH